jgi:hypothetical protein
MPTASPKNIVVTNNFLSKEEIDILLDALEQTIEWQTTVMAFSDELKAYTDTITTFDKVSEDVKNTISNIWKKAYTTIEYIYGIRLFAPKNIRARKWAIGEYQDPHSDSEFNVGKLIINDNYFNDHNNIPESYSSFLITYSSVVYLNDNYSGGELYFPEYGLTFKPKAGDLITFPSNAKYIHGVTPVKDVERYTLPILWYSEQAIVANILSPNKMISEVANEILNRI